MLQVREAHAPKGERARDPRTLSLRIKRVHLESIASGEKTTEYREFSPYYHRLFLSSFNRLQLHYQTSRRVEVEVKNVRIEEREGVPMYALDLGRIHRNVH